MTKKAKFCSEYLTSYWGKQLALHHIQNRLTYVATNLHIYSLKLKIINCIKFSINAQEFGFLQRQFKLYFDYHNLKGFFSQPRCFCVACEIFSTYRDHVGFVRVVSPLVFGP